MTHCERPPGVVGTSGATSSTLGPDIRTGTLLSPPSVPYAEHEGAVGSLECQLGLIDTGVSDHIGERLLGNPVGGESHTRRHPVQLP